MKRILVMSALVLLLFPACQSDSGDGVTGEEVVRAAVLAMVDGAGDKSLGGYQSTRADEGSLLPIDLSGVVYPGITLSGNLTGISFEPVVTFSGTITVAFDNFTYEGCWVNGEIPVDFSVSFIIPAGETKAATGSLTVVLNGDLELSGIVNGPVTFTDLKLVVEGEDAKVSSGSLNIFGVKVDPNTVF